jgi:hypothetical protein
MLCSTDTAVDSEAPDKNPASFHRNKKRKIELRASILRYTSTTAVDSEAPDENPCPSIETECDIYLGSSIPPPLAKNTRRKHRSVPLRLSPIIHPGQLRSLDFPPHSASSPPKFPVLHLSRLRETEKGFTRRGLCMVFRLIRT